MATEKKCPECGDTFTADADWKKVCLSCYLARKEHTGERRVKQLEEQVAYWQNLAQGDKSNEVDRLSRRCGRLADELAEARRQNAYLQNEVARLKSSGSPPPRFHFAGSIPPDMLKRLIQLCHPDKHDGKDSAVRATQCLLEQR